jgi:lipopolysaccharide/colanic/teichoic acid biosynthesis glycosyltransferase
MTEHVVCGALAAAERGAAHPSLDPAKRIVDVVLSAAGLVLLSPLLCIIALSIKLTSPGSVLFKRTVYAQGGRRFVMLKFRSMVENAHDMLMRDPNLLEEYERNLKIADDRRITRLGQILRRLSLDELPQLLNVLTGDMSLVGPRVLGDVEMKRYGVVRDKILTVKPGLTGLWQVSGRQNTSFEDRTALDVQYIHTWSLRLDAVILVKTLVTVVGMQGAR